MPPLMLMRSAVALLLGAGLFDSCRWLPSEANAADEPSRTWEPPRKGGGETSGHVALETAPPPDCDDYMDKDLTPGAPFGCRRP